LLGFVAMIAQTESLAILKDPDLTPIVQVPRCADNFELSLKRVFRKKGPPSLAAPKIQSLSIEQSSQLKLRNDMNRPHCWT
jgi:hypothetical protein